MRLPFAGFSYGSQVFVGGLAIHGLDLALPIFMMQLYDRILPNSSLATLGWLAAATVGALLLEAALKSSRQRWAHWAAERALYRARGDLVDRLTVRPVPPARAREAFGALRTLITDSYHQKAFFRSDLPFGILYLGLIFLIHPYLCLTLACLGLVLAVSGRALRPTYARLVVEKEDLLRDREALVEATFGSMAEWKALGAEELVARHHRRLQDKIRDLDDQLSSLETTRLGITKAIEALSVFGPLILGGTLVIEGRLTLGALTACVLLARRALGPMMGLAERWSSEVDLQQARKKLYRASGLSEVPELQVQKAYGNFPPSGAPLRLESVILRKGLEAGVVPDDDQMILSVDSHEFPPGTWVKFEDPDQEPLEHLFRAIRGTNPFYSGQILLGDQDIAALPLPTLGRLVALVEPSVSLFPGTFIENLGSFDPELQPLALTWASKVGLDPVVEGLDRGYETLVTDRLVANLAPGVLQRMGLARALALSPRILVLNRLEASLDPDSRRRCLAALQELPDLIVLSASSTPGFGTATVTTHTEGGRLRFREVRR